MTEGCHTGVTLGDRASWNHRQQLDKASRVGFARLAALGEWADLNKSLGPGA